MNLRSTAAPRRKITRQRAGALALTAIVLASTAVVGGVASAQAAGNISTAPLNIILGVGATESQRIVSWYYPTGDAQAVQLEKQSDLTAGAFNTSARTIAATTTANTAGDTSVKDATVAGATNQAGYYNAHASLLGLAENTTYVYHVGAANGTNWSPTYTFSTKSFSGNFDFLFLGDPQIGSSGNATMDGAGLAATLNYATTNDPAAELIVSGGDQVEHANDEAEWAAFSDSSSVLKQVPFAATIGNHDVGGKAYEQHTSLPNISKDADYYPNTDTVTNSGGDYYYIYKGVLFIDINSNAYAGNSDSAHVAYVRSVIGAVGAQAKWTVLVYHHSIYSPADHANDADNAIRRTDFTTAFSDLGVDMVLQGHDHSYSRSYAIKNGAKANVDEQPAATEIFSGPGGVIYVTANSASGSKYYDLTKPTGAAGYGADPLDPTGNRHFANSVEDQEHVRTYVQVSVTDNKLSVKDVRAGTCAAPNSAVELGKVATCGFAGTGLNPTASSVAQPVGTNVDAFTLDAVLPATSVALTASQASSVYGSTAPVALTASVTGGLGKLAGNVTFYEGDTKLGTSDLLGNSATLTVPAGLSVGSHSYTAKFASTNAFTGTASSSSATGITVTQAASTSAVSYANGVVTVGVTSPGLAVNGSATIYDGTTPIALATITNGVGTAKVSLKTSGTHTLVAVFASNGTIAASSSNSVAVKIAKSTTTVKYAKKVATITVKATGVSVSGTAKLYDGKKVLKTVKITKGKGTYKVSLKKGTHKLHAVFALTPTVAASTSKTVTYKIK